MADAITQLIELLRNKESELKELVQLLEEEQQFLLKSDVAGLESQGEKKKELYARVDRSTVTYKRLLAQVGAEHGVANATKLSQILPQLPQSQCEPLQEVQHRLLTLGEELERLNSSNGNLLQGAYSTVSRSLEFFFRILNRSNTYGEAGRFVEKGSSHRLLRREA